MLSQLLNSSSMITSEMELQILNLLRTTDRPAVKPCFVGESEYYVNILCGGRLSFDLHDGLSLAAFFALFSPPEAVRVSALILAYAYPVNDGLLQLLLRHRITSTSIPFVLVMDVFDKAVQMSRIRQAARIVAMAELLNEDRIELCSREGESFFRFFNALQIDLRLKLVDDDVIFFFV